MGMSDDIDSEYNQIKLNILKVEYSTDQEKEVVKESIRKFENDYELNEMNSRLWDFYDLIVNRKTSNK